MNHKISIIFAIRIESGARMRNLIANLRYLMQYEDVCIDIIEAGDKRHFDFHSERIRYKFVKDHRPVLYRTYYINALLLNAKCSTIGIWDADIIIPKEQIDRSIEAVKKGSTIVLPYNGNVRFLDRRESDVFYRNYARLPDSAAGYRIMRRPSVGGALIVDKKKYWQIGRDNENIIGWGFEDIERIVRAEMLGAGIERADGVAFHLDHPVKDRPDSLTSYNRARFLDICRSSPEILLEEISAMKGKFQYMKKWVRVMDEIERLHQADIKNSILCPEDKDISAYFPVCGPDHYIGPQSAGFL